MPALPPLRSQLLEEAHALDVYALRRVTELENDKDPLETKLAEKNAEIDAARGSHERCIQFAAALTIESHALCPRCWVTRGQTSEMVAVSSGTLVSRFECYICGFEAKCGRSDPATVA